jgi:hypothetical protein
MRQKIDDVLRRIRIAKDVILMRGGDMASDDDRDRFIEYQCSQCGVHQEFPDGAEPDTCVSCTGGPLVRRIVGPLQLRKQVRNAVGQIERLWEAIGKIVLDVEKLKGGRE